MNKKAILIIVMLLHTTQVFALQNIGRLGIGMADTVATGLDVISFKLQRSRSIALGAMVGLNSTQDSSTYAAGLKLYRVIYEEPNLNFYSAFQYINFTYNETTTQVANGYQFDGLFGSEFSFQGLESIGFSFEFGIGLNKYNGNDTFKTFGNDTIKSAIHFYL